MRHLRSVVLLALVSSVSISAHAQFTDNYILFDSYSTSVGSSALATETSAETSNGCGSFTCGLFNTATGYSALFDNTSGAGNTANGYATLFENTTGSYNVAVGYEALMDNETGSGNSAFGLEAASQNNGSENTAIGSKALAENTTGSYSTAVGAEAMSGDSGSGSGNYNTATGYAALGVINSGSYNTASGATSLGANSTGAGNTAAGYASLAANNANYNSAIGYSALLHNANGAQNTATGTNALLDNKSGNYNTAVGTGALRANTTGSSNTALGFQAGSLITGSNDIDIGSTGVAGESATIRIGTAGTHGKTFIAGIYSTSPLSGGGSVVIVNSKGELGVQGSSSERFKKDIAPMGSSTEKLEQLRPVTFHYKGDANGPVQYGLIGEEVAHVYPELVVRDTAGAVINVRYDELAPMLLNELRNQRTKITAQSAEIRELKRQQLVMQSALMALNQRNREEH
jgi:hypothetical protein